jgi:pimeloyl-ACP methyl ester carboxylesterase
MLAAQYHPIAMLLRPLWDSSRPDEIDSWNPFSEDLQRFLDEGNYAPVIAIGHSVGATVALRAALRAPDHFSALVLLDPVLLPRRVMLEWWLARALGLGYLLHPKIRGSLKRRRRFDDLGQVFAGYRQRPIFRYLSDENLRIFVEGMTRPSHGGGHVLAYSPEWETRVYYTGIWNDWDLWSGLPHLGVPTLIIRGAQSDTFLESTAGTVRARNPRIEITTLDHATHLVPLERPTEVHKLIHAFLRKVLPPAA